VTGTRTARRRLRNDRGDVPPDPSVLNTTVLSNFAYIDELWVVADISGICTVPVVREELENGIDDRSYLQAALNILDDVIPGRTYLGHSRKQRSNCS